MLPTPSPYPLPNYQIHQNTNKKNTHLKSFFSIFHILCQTGNQFERELGLQHLTNTCHQSVLQKRIILFWQNGLRAQTLRHWSSSAWAVAICKGHMPVSKLLCNLAEYSSLKGNISIEAANKHKSSMCIALHWYHNLSWITTDPSAAWNTQSHLQHMRFKKKLLRRPCACGRYTQSPCLHLLLAAKWHNT